MLQPSSIDVRLDRYFRVFENHRYPHIDPAADQTDLTRQVEPDVDRAGLQHHRVPRLHGHATGVDLGEDVPVGEQHGDNLPGPRRDPLG